MTYLAIFTALLIIALIFVVRKLYKFGVLLLTIQDAIEESLDILDERYASITQILQKPVFFDSLEIRQVLDDISKTRDAILYIANKLNAAQEIDIDVKKESR